MDTRKLEFSYPADLNQCMAERKALKLSKRLLHRITCGIYDSIGSIQLHFKDGVDTGGFGSYTG